MILGALLQHEDAENIGYIIPPPVIQHFITDFERNGRYTAFPALGVEWQKMESPFLRKALGMSVSSLRPSAQRLSPLINLPMFLLITHTTSLGFKLYLACVAVTT